mmetsp:Transcript_51606/g.118536  ORF Transcript_51606/g.118536 Transcript_51606/m.118536 type:complete len:310 (-) Transcript_51606:743-1672(-)
MRRCLHEAISSRRLGVRVLVEFLQVASPNERRVAQVVRHHDGRVERREIERRNRLLVEALDWIDDSRALKLVAFLRLARSYREEQPERLHLAVELRHDLDLLATSEQVREGHAGDASHLDVIDDAHELLQQPLRQVRVFQAVDGEAAARVGIALLQNRNDRMVDVFLLLPKKVRTDRIERVRGELVVTHHHHHHVELHSPLDIDLLGLACPRLLRLEHLILHTRRQALDPPQIRKRLDLECLRTIEQIWQVKIDDVVAGDDVSVAREHKLVPRAQHLCLGLEREHLRTTDWRAFLQREDVLHDGLCLAL